MSRKDCVCNDGVYNKLQTFKYKYMCLHMPVCMCVTDTQLEEKEINIEITLHVWSTSAPTEGWELDCTKTTGLTQTPLYAPIANFIKIRQEVTHLPVSALCAT
jgi:hypothetical protein